MGQRRSDSFIHSFVHSFNKNLSKISYEPSTILGAEEMAANKAGSHGSHILVVGVGEGTFKKANICQMVISDRKKNKGSGKGMGGDRVLFYR